jgi:hypothetical protein
MIVRWPLLLAAVLAALALLPAVLRGQSGRGGRRAGGLEILRVELPDGATWTLGPGGVGRPFRVRILLVNRGGEPLRIWDPANSEGSQAPIVVLTGAGGRRTVLRPPPFERSGAPTVWTIEPQQLRAIELDLLRLVGERSLEPGTYTLQAGYENALPAVGGMGGVWTGRVASEGQEVRVVRPPGRDE